MAASFQGTGQAVGAQANVDACFGQAAEGERLMPKEKMAPRTMHDVSLSARKQGSITVGQIVDMHRQEVRGESAAAFEVPHRRAQATIRHVSRAALEPIEH